MMFGHFLLEVFPFIFYPALHGGNIATTIWAKNQGGWELNDLTREAPGTINNTKQIALHVGAAGAQIALDKALKNKPKARTALRVASVLILGYAMYRDFHAGDEARAYKRRSGL